MVRIRKLLGSLGYSVLDPTPLPPSVVAMYRPDNRPAKRTPTPGEPSRGRGKELPSRGRGKELDVTKKRLIMRARNHRNIINSSPASSEGASNMLGFSISPSYNEADQEVDQPVPSKRKYYIKEEELIKEEEFDEEDQEDDEEGYKEEEDDDEEFEDFKKEDFEDFKEEEEDFEEVEEEVLKVVKVERDRTKLKIQLKREKRITRKSTTDQNGEEMRNNMSSEISRCGHVNERGWRCNGQRLMGYSLCQNHLGENIESVNDQINNDVAPDTDEAIVKGHPSTSTNDSYSYDADDDTEGID